VGGVTANVGGAGVGFGVGGGGGGQVRGAGGSLAVCLRSFGASEEEVFDALKRYPRFDLQVPMVRKYARLIHG